MQRHQNLDCKTNNPKKTQIYHHLGKNCEKSSSHQYHKPNFPPASGRRQGEGCFEWTLPGVKSYYIMSYHIKWYQIILYHIISYHIISNHIIVYCVISILSIYISTDPKPPCFCQRVGPCKNLPAAKRRLSNLCSSTNFLGSLSPKSHFANCLALKDIGKMILTFPSWGFQSQSHVPRISSCGQGLELVL